MNKLGNDATLVYLVNLARDYREEVGVSVAGFLVYCAKRRAVGLTMEQALDLIEGGDG